MQRHPQREPLGNAIEAFENVLTEIHGGFATLVAEASIAPATTDEAAAQRLRNAARDLAETARKHGLYSPADS